MKPDRLTTSLTRLGLLSVLLLGISVPPVLAQSAPQANPDQQSTYELLADALENKAVRKKLIEHLRAMDAGDTGTAAKDQPEPAPEPSTARQLAEATQAFAASVATKINRVVVVIRGEGETRSAADFDAAAFAYTLIRLLLVVAATIVVYLILRKLAGPLFARAGHWAVNAKAGASRVGRRVLAASGAFGIDLLTIAIAGAVGYGLAIFVLGEAASLGTRASLFLNAFMMIEAFKAVIRLIFASRYEGLRLFTLPPDIADWWSIRLRSLAGMIGYALLVVVPIINLEISRAAGALAGLVIMLLAYAYALYLIIGNRKAVGARLDERAAAASTALFGILLRVFGKTWHWLAVAYFTVLLVVSQIAPEEALPYMVGATVKSAIAIGVGLLLSAALTEMLNRPLRLSPHIRNRMPGLESRLNTYVPSVLQTVRIALLVLVAIIAIDAWQIFSLGTWLTSGAGQAFLAALVQIAIILLIALGIWTVCASIMEARMQAPNATPRTVTLMTLFRNALAVVIGVITFMIVLAEMGMDIGPLIASAGVIGLAIGFGAQKLVQDIITGVFIQIENALNTGDWVAIAGVDGGVERLSIRSVALRDLSGTLHVVPFSNVGVVSNYSREFGYHVGEYRISLREDIDEAIMHLRAAFEDLKADSTISPYILEDLIIPGVTALADSSVNVRAMIKTTAGMQWAVGRAYNRVVKIHFDAAGIEIPYPHRMMYFGADKDGNSHPAPVRVFASDEEAPASRPRADKRGTKPADTDFNQRDVLPDDDDDDDTAK